MKQHYAEYIMPNAGTVRTACGIRKLGVAITTWKANVTCKGCMNTWEFIDGRNFR